MAQSNNTRLQRFAAKHYMLRVHHLIGSANDHKMRELMEAIRGIYEHVEPSKLNGGWRLALALPDRNDPLRTIRERVSERYLKLDTLALSLRPGCVVFILPDEQFYVCNETTVSELNQILGHCLVYRYEHGVEHFVVNGTDIPIDKPVPCDSTFAIPAFKELLEALEHYKIHIAQFSKCPHLEKIWVTQLNRYYLCIKPEKFMRDSLEYFLRASLREVEVRPEQNVDASHPVDLKVTWTETRRIALIEIKWVGKSLHSDGHKTTEYSEARANSGAQQLADYLDSNNSRVPHFTSRGYLVVFDARRRGLTTADALLTSADALHFEHAEIEYRPAYHSTRQDFETPIRFFMRPVIDG